MGSGSVVVTGIGLVTPLGRAVGEVLDRIERGERVACRPTFDLTPFSCPVCAPIEGFDAEEYFPELKTLRLMSRAAQLAVVAARLAIADAGIEVDRTYGGGEIAVFGASGLAAPPMEEIVDIFRETAAPDGTFDVQRFGRVGLKRIRPVLSFQVLGNMPVCFVSICEELRGENAAYTPWEGQGAQAIVSGIRAIRSGRAPCALVGGCDVKTHVVAFFCLQQLGLFESWVRNGRGPIPGEGASFLVLEDEERALRRGARVYARIPAWVLSTADAYSSRGDSFAGMFSRLAASAVEGFVGAGDGDASILDAENEGRSRAGIAPQTVLHPKESVGNLYAGAAALQVALGAELARRGGRGWRAIASCADRHSEQGAFVLEGI
ncbi:MAG: beta-ketoacyl synthase N-terminal-like domain-containing protein [Planctomycetota bacterium]